jgi:hypothetical protein
MGRKLTRCRNGRMCFCGALAAVAAGRCEKRRRRSRWMRRKMPRDSGRG